MSRCLIFSRLVRVTPSVRSIARTSATAASISRLRAIARSSMGVDYASPVHFPGGGNMAIKASRIDVWMTIIDDRAGGAAEKLEALAKAGADLEVVFARRTPEQPGQGILFATPIEGAKVVRAAQEAGFRKSETIHGIRVEGTDKAGLGGRIARALAEAGLSCRGLQASVIGRNFLSFIALDTAEDAAKAVKVLRKL